MVVTVRAACRDDIRTQLGVDSHVKKYTGCSDGIFKRFEDSNDVCVSYSSVEHLAFPSPPFSVLLPQADRSPFP
jgi:hypothetical protein